jgi:hypothetical protein
MNGWVNPTHYFNSNCNLFLALKKGFVQLRIKFLFYSSSIVWNYHQIIDFSYNLGKVSVIEFLNAFKYWFTGSKKERILKVCKINAAQS